ncbi:g7061 [Coccomyxa viridis]|uniref:G7061 protein n=1 Tax=Coccomyxa viridis TaxID=1274662 RepID=A0ABP1G1R6_9CHLO
MKMSKTLLAVAFLVVLLSSVIPETGARELTAMAPGPGYYRHHHHHHAEAPVPPGPHHWEHHPSKPPGPWHHHGKYFHGAWALASPLEAPPESSNQTKQQRHLHPGVLFLTTPLCIRGRLGRGPTTGSTTREKHPAPGITTTTASTLAKHLAHGITMMASTTTTSTTRLRLLPWGKTAFVA